MPEYSFDELVTLERTPQSPHSLCEQLWGVLSHSVVARARVLTCDRDTGEYRIVLQGTLDTEPPDLTASA